MDFFVDFATSPQVTAPVSAKNNENLPRKMNHGEFGELVHVDSVDGFREWLNGQTLPVVEGAEDPFGWAYACDYEQFLKNPHYIED